jgi:flagellar biosynthesis protein FlhF
MTLKTYEAPTMGEVLAEVKRDLGRDAVILHMRRSRKGGLWGLWGQNVWEVTASGSVNVPRRIARGSYVPEPRAEEGVATGGPAGKTPVLAPAAGEDETPGEHPPAETPRVLTGQVANIHRMVEVLLARTATEGGQESAIPAELQEFQRHLVAQNVREQTVSEFLRQLCMDLTGQQLGDRKLVREALRKMVASRIRTAGDEVEGGPARSGRARLIALIGPTGVGKTTTIAKLAANYKLRGKKKVGLITIDTYRIAAVDQLRTYADIIEVPLKAVLTTGELHEAVRAMRDLDVVLIDTAGRSQNNRLRLNQLRSFLNAVRPEEVHLVVSATGNQTCTRRVLDCFLPLGANRLIVSKLDEAGTFGVFLNVSSAAGRPISYVTTGQDVPDDICPADADALAECILAGRFGEEIDVN